MNYRQPLQRKDDGKWQFGCANGAISWPEGYCATNDCRHDTAEEAAACYRRWMVEQSSSESIDDSSQSRCLLCEEWTQRLIMVRGWPVGRYCSKHTLRESAEHATRDFYSEVST